MLRFIVPGPPVPLQRPRVVHAPRRVGYDPRPPGVRTYTPKESVEYQRNVALYCRQAKGREPWPMDARYAVTLRVYWPDARRRDADNCLKQVLDGLTSVAYDDDSQVMEIHVYASIDRANPRLEAEVSIVTVEEVA